MKLHQIYIFYVKNNECNDIFYEEHYKLLEYYSHIFDSIHIIIVIDQNLFYESDIIYRIKAKLISILHNNDLTISYEFNDPNYREGLYFKKYVFDNLNKFKDTLIFFGHTKGVTNEIGYENDKIDNMKLWIYSMYYLNLNWINEVKRKLVDETNYIFYGSLYFKDARHNNVNNWFYSGSFYWINPNRLISYISKNDLDTNFFFKPENERLMRCAELFVGIVPYTHAAFHSDERFNKEYEAFHNFGHELSYNYIENQIKLYLNVWEYDDLKISFNNLINEQ